MDIFITKYCLSLLLLTSITTTSGDNDTNHDVSREPRVSGRIVKLYSGVKPELYTCTGEGFQADRLNCAVFYRCVKERSGKFTVFRYQCAPGTVYDPDVETCNHPRSTRRSECGSMLKPTAKPSYATININEINGVQSEVPRPISTKVPVYTEKTTFNPPTLSWSLSTKWINLPTLKPSELTTPSSLKATQKTPTIASFSTKYPWVTSQQLTESEYTKAPLPPKTTQQSISKTLDPCTSDGFMGDSENCRKFYRCVGNQRGGYVKYEFSCSEPTVWDDEIQGCNHPWAVKRSKCGRSISFNDITQKMATDSTEKSITHEYFMSNRGYGYKSNKTIQNQLQISQGSHVQQIQTQISNSNDAIQNQIQINYGEKISSNTVSKQNQTQISFGNAVSQSQTQIDYGHKGVQTQLQIDHSKNSSQSQVQIQESTTSQISTSSQNYNFDKNKCSENGFMGDSNDCKKFYRCVDNGKGTYMKYEYFCGDGTVWDPKIEACNHAWAVKHCGGNLPLDINEGYHTTVKSTEHYTETTKNTPVYQTTSNVPDIDDEDDVGYGNQNQESSSSTTTAKPSISKSTTAQSTSTTTEKLNGTTTECTFSGFIGDANDCKIFYRCVDNGKGSYTKYEFKCGDGTLWDPNIEACNHAWAVKSCGGSTSNNVDVETTSKKEFSTTQHSQTTVTFIQTTMQIPTQEDDYDTGYGSQNKEPSITTVRSTKQPENEDTDKNNQCRSSGFIGDHNDCKKFYRCVDNSNGGYTRYDFTCGEGTVWDSKIEACNHAWAVEKCGGGNTIENIETTSQATHSTSHIKTTSGIHTTETSEITDIPTHMTTSTTTKRPTSLDTNYKCSHSGFMGDNSDCKKFYRCVDNGDGSYSRYEFTCGEGTVWDPEIDACNHAWAVEKCGGNSEPISTIATQQTTSQHPVLHHDEDQLDTGYGNVNDEMTEYPQHGTTIHSADKTPNMTSSEGRICKNSGFVGDKNDCKKFYRCVDNGKNGYDRYEFSCGEGTAWDSSTEACNHIWAVKDCGGSGSSSTQNPNSEGTTQSAITSVAPENGHTQQSTEKTSTTQNPNENDIMSDKCTREGYYGNKNDCKFFYRCVDNGKGGFTKYDFACSEGTTWNPEIQGCDHNNPNRPCALTPSQEPANLNDDIDTQTSTTKSSTTTKEEENSGSTQTINKPESSNGNCESEGFYGNPTNCKKFYRCVANGNGGFIKYDFDCGEGTVWNQEIQACDHKSIDNKCSSSYPSPETSNQSASTPNIDSTTTKEEGTTTYYSTTKKHESTDQTDSCSSEGFFSHPSNCKKFLRCVNNGKGGYTRYEFSCGDGTVWVQEIQACDHDNDVSGCNAQSQSTTTSHNTKESSTSSTLESRPMSSTESMIPSKENDEFETENSKEPSNDNCNREGFFPKKEDCRKFYRCVDNGNGGYTKYDFDCGEGTAWDQDLQTCNHIYEVESCFGKSEEGNENQQTTTNKNSGETDNTSTFTKSTPPSSESSTSSSSNSQDKCKNEGYYGDSKDCKKFYRCVDNGEGGYTKYDFTCADGTIWDRDIINCNHPEDVSNPSCNSSQDNIQSSSTGQESNTSITTDSSNSTTSNTTESTSSQSSVDCSQESTKTPSSTKVNCDHAGYYANPNDCKKFYRCVDWDGDGKRFSVFHFECGEGTIWDPALDTCNHEDSVYPQRDCSQTQSQNVTEETTTTEGTTTEESSTSEQTTTQQLTTEESTTTQRSTTSEKTTTQESTTTEKTTTQESSTSEQSTTEQSTTSEKTSTQEFPTSEQTTTQESTTAEQTTTQQTTTSEKATTQESTTSEQTTTPQSTTSEQTTTQESATDSQTSAQESTTSEQTTSQESTTSEQTTIHQSTASEQTTQESSTSKETTEETTEESTTSKPTTDEQTTQQSTTEQSSESTIDDTSTTEQMTDSTSTDESTTESSTESTTAPTTEESSSSSKDCPETEDDQYLLVCPTSFRRHPKYCNMFYQCTEDDDTSEAKVAMFKCPNNTIYDESQTQCVSEDKADKKCEGEIANKRRFKRLGSNYKDPIVADKGKLSCPTTGYFSFEKNSECSKGFLKCEKSVYGLIKGHVYQCPDGYIYWAISKRCERVDSIKDCKKTSNDWTGRWNIPVERKNLAIR